jgi:proteic killer suppression protein
MIQSFSDPEAERIFHQERSKKLPLEIQKRALIKLLMIDASEDETDLRIPPSNRFEHLNGSLKEYCSIRINDQWRIVFKFKDGDAFEVSIADYH